WTNDDLSDPDVQGWLAGAKETPGSWWTDWDRWLASHSGEKVPARAPGQKFPAIENAPGSYVKVRFDKR
ncbi:MAG TPA: class I poly(R)-hydroxyalkanoic acid synthase, partial [Paracoccaceae bacterium]|nr:class I poly(R)-hydroxyalkanoic acid synthase [Paracoccaceae bacterium]